MRITKRAVDAAHASEKRRFLWDSDLKGFGLVVQPSGAKSYVVRYYTPSGRDRRMKLGAHGELTPDMARKRAADVLANVRAGHDPLAEHEDQRRAVTFAELVPIYRERHLSKLKTRTVGEYERLIEREMLPGFGARRLDDLSAGEIAKWHATRRSPYAANRALAVLRSILELAARWGLRDPAKPNPCAYVERNREQGRERFLSDEELSRFGAALVSVAQDEPRSRLAVAALRLLILTGARRNEVLRLRWENLDREHGIAWLEDSKTDRRPLRLSEPAWEVLDGLRGDVPRLSGWCFPSYRVANAPISDIRRTFSAVCSVARLDNLRLHDLRHSHASVAAGEGVSLQLIGKLLGHKRATTTERYAHLADDPVRDAAERVQAKLAERLAKTPADVAPLKRR